MAEKRNISIVTNISKQMIQLQMRPPRGDFYADERQIRLLPGKSVEIPSDYILAPQIENLMARGHISVSYS